MMILIIVLKTSTMEILINNLNNHYNLNFNSFNNNNYNKPFFKENYNNNFQKNQNSKNYLIINYPNN